MNWTIERINDCNNVTTVEQQERSRILNSYALFMINTKNDLSGSAHLNDCNGNVTTIQGLYRE